MPPSATLRCGYLISSLKLCHNHHTNRAITGWERVKLYEASQRECEGGGPEGEGEGRRQDFLSTTVRTTMGHGESPPHNLRSKAGNQDYLALQDSITEHQRENSYRWADNLPAS